MTGGDIRAAILPVITRFDELGVPWHIGGSVASSILGVARTTIDVDLVAALPLELVPGFAAGLGEEFYIDEGMIRDAVRRRSCFNLVHLPTMLKVDVFVAGDRPYDRMAFSRRRRDTLEEEGLREPVWVASPEDVILNKLECFRAGGEVSDRQYRDVLGVLRIQGTCLDLGYLRSWAGDLGLVDLLDRALADAATDGPWHGG